MNALVWEWMNKVSSKASFEIPTTILHDSKVMCSLNYPIYGVTLQHNILIMGYI